MNDNRESFVARVIRLYLEDPHTPEVPSSADWDIAHNLYDRGIPIDTVRLAFQLAFVRRHTRASTDPLPPIRSLAYFRAVALNLSPDERDPIYASYIDDLYHRLIAPPTPENHALQPESRGSS